MHKTSASEFLLARITNPTRAAAIMGDLLELSVTRSRLYFWTHYLRTVLSLGWRTGGSAFILAFLCVRFLLGAIIGLLMLHRTSHLMDPGLFGENNPHIRMVCWNFSMVTAQFLCFAFSFVWIRFGRSNRLTQLAGTLFLVSMPVYTLRPWVMDLSGVVTILILCAALVVSRWRKPLAVLAGTCLAAIAVKATCFVVLYSYLYRHVPRMLVSWVVVSDAACFAVAAIVCLYLYRLLLRQRSALA